MDLNLSFMTFFGNLIGFIFPLIIIFSVVSALAANKGSQTGRGDVSGFDRTNLNRKDQDGGGADWLNLNRVNRSRPDRSMNPDRNLDASDVMGSPRLNSDRSLEDFRGQQTVGNLGNFLGDIIRTRNVESSGSRLADNPGRSEPLSTMKKTQEEQRATSQTEREKRYAYDGQSSQSKSSTRDQIEREKRYSYDTQGYESKASNYVNPPGAVLQKISTAVAISTATKRQESFIGGMGNEFLDSADQYLKMGDYHLNYKPGGLYSYSESHYDLKTLNLKGGRPVIAATFREVDKPEDKL